MNPTQFRRFVIDPVLQDLGLWSPAAVALMLGTALHESAGLQYISQVVTGSAALLAMSLGPGIGVYQMERPTHADLFDTFLDLPRWRDLGAKVQAYLGSTPSPDRQLASNLAYATAVARAKYYRAPDALPAAGDVDGLARYWKRFWNTVAGAGTPEQFLANWQRHGAAAALEQ